MKKLFLVPLAVLCLVHEVSAQRYLKQSTAVNLNSCAFVDSTDGDTAETGLTISQADVRLSKNFGTYAQKNSATSCTHKEGGIYSCPVNTTDTNTVGPLDVLIHEAGALVCEQHYVVIPANAYDALVSGTDVLQADVTQFNNVNGTFASGRPDVNTTFIAGSIVSTSTAQIGANMVSGSANAITATVIQDAALSAAKLSASGLFTIRKNVASQKFGLFLLNATTSAGVTGLASGAITCTISKDFAAFATTNDTTEAETGSGLYWIDLTQAETNADQLNFICTGTGAANWIVSIVTQH